MKRGWKKSGLLLKWNKHIYNFTPNPHLTKVFIDFFNFKDFLVFGFQFFILCTCVLEYTRQRHWVSHVFECYSKPYPTSRSWVRGTRWRYGRSCSTAPSIPTLSASSTPSSVPTSWGWWAGVSGSDTCIIICLLNS